MAAIDGAADGDLVRRTWSGPVHVPEKLPAAVDVVVIGGGIVGVSSAWFLKKQGLTVAVCEKGHVGGEQSGRNWGWVRQQGRDPRELPMMMESIRIWDGLAGEIGEDLGFTRAGCLFAARTEKDLAALEDWLPVAKEFGLDTRIIDAAGLADHVRGAARGWAGAMYTASDGRAEPHRALPALARALAREGGHVLGGCAVRGVDVEGGRVAGVVTEHGRIRARAVLCAAGAWTSMFCRSLRITVPQLRVKGTVMRTVPGPDVLTGNLFDEKIGIRRRADGGYTVAPGSILEHAVTPSSFRYLPLFFRALMQERNVVKLSFGREFLDEWRTPKEWDLDEPSPFEATRVLDPAPGERALRTVRRELGRVFPQLAALGVAEAWAGIIESSPDVVPIIGEADALPGFYVATGFSGHGFGIGPGAGYAIAGMIADRDTGIDLEPLRPGRFFDGSPIRPQVTI